tara:strand:+ start:3955 stop:4161 length:207 start_codon:yes stop_codon:yes gene_type:complete
MQNQLNKNIPPVSIIPLLLIILSLLELRNEIKLLLDHFTFISLIFAIKENPLPIIILLLSPQMIKKYN